MKKHLTVFLLITTLAGLGFPRLLEAGNYRWVETETWNGSDEWTSRLFEVKADKWRVRLKRSREGGMVKIHVYNADHERLHSLKNRTAPFRGYKQLSGKGRYYLKVEAEDVNWQVSIRQLLNRRQDWQLLQDKQARQKQLRKLAVWSGRTQENMTFAVPPTSESWRLRADVRDDAELTVRVEKRDGNNFSARRINIAEDQAPKHTWFNHTGEFEITVEKATGAWHLAVDYYRRDKKSGTYKDDLMSP